MLTYCLSRLSLLGHLLLLAVLFGGNLSTVALAQPAFERTYSLGATTDAAAYAIQSLTDGYIVAGQAATAGNVDALLMRLDLAGNIVWSQTYGGLGTDRAFGVVAVADGYVFAGTTNSAPSLNQDIWVVKTNLTGAVQWVRRIDNGTNDFAGADPIAPTADGGYLITGHTEVGGTATANWNTLVAKLDANGAPQWQNHYNMTPTNPFRDQGHSVLELPNGTVVVAGLSDQGPVAGTFRGLLGSLNAAGGGATGLTVDVEPVGSLFRLAVFTQVRLAADGDLLLSGYATGAALTNQINDLILAKVSPAGVPRFTRMVGGTGQESEGAKVVQAATGGFLLGGTTQSFGAGGQDFYLVKYSATGTLEWDATFGGGAQDSLTAVARAADGGLVAIGFTRSFGPSQQVYLVKVPDNAPSGCSSTNPASLEPGTGFSTSILGPAITALPNTGTATPTVTAVAPSSLNPCCVNFSALFAANSVCAGQPTTFQNQSNANGTTTFEWDFLDEDYFFEVTTNNFNDVQFTFPAAGAYNVRLVASNNFGCADTFQTTVVVNPIPVANAGANQTICQGDSIQLIGLGSTGGQEFSWTPTTNMIDPTSGAPLVFPQATTTYQMVYTNTTTGCRDTAAVTITVNNAPAANAGPDQTVCRGVPTALTATGGVSYSWVAHPTLTGGNTATPTVTPDTTTSYIVVVSDAIGCSARDTVRISVPRLVVADSAFFCQGLPDLEITAGFNLPGAATFVWRNAANAVIGNDATLTIVPAANQWVFVEGTLLGCTQRDSVFIRLATPPTVTASANVAICAGKSTPLTASGAQTYSWSPVDGLSATNIANPTARPTATTTYTVTGTDAQGCQNTAQVTVTVNPQPVVNLRSDTLICFGTCITLDAGPNGTSYEWFTTGNISNPNIRNPEVCPTADVRYTVQVTGPNGCITRDSVNIFVRPEILAQITPSATSICQGDSVCLTATGAGVYEWFTDDAGIPGPIFGTRQCFFPSQTTTYKMVPGVGPCKGDTVYQTITVRPTPFAAIRAQRLGCTFDTVTVEFVGIRVPNDLSVWSFGTNANVVSGSGFGPYEVYWTLAGRKFITLQVEANGCTSVDTAFIDVFSKPTVDAGSAVEYCQGGAGVVLQGSTFTPDSAASCVYTWTPFAGLDNPFTLNPIARPSVTTTYYLQAFCNSCPSENIDSVVVTVLPRPTAVIDTFQLAFCAGSGGVQLPGSGFGGVGARSYEWFPKNGLSDGFSPTPVANPTVTTEYCLVVRDANNCPSDTACIQVIVHPVPQANAGPDQFLCTGTNQGVFLQGTAIGGGFGSFSYRWEPATGLSNPNVPNPFAAPDSTTIYTLFVTNNLTGCTSVPTTLDTVSTVVVNVTRTPQAVAGPARSICRGESINIGGTPRFCTPNCVFSWTPTLGLSDPTILSPLASPQFTTTYWLTVTNNGCTSIADSVTVTVRPAPTLDILRPVVDICPGDSVRIETTIGGIPANSPVVYQWTPTAGLSDPTAAEPLASPTQTTTYYLAATAEGCVGPVRDSIVVQVFPMPQIDVAQRRILRCNEDADSLTLPVTVTASVEPFFIEWSPANQVSDPTIANPRVRPLESTKYFIRVTTANCVVRDSIEIIVLPAIGAEIEASQPIACRGDEVTLRASGPSAATYSWSPADGLSSTSGPVVTATPDQTTTYVLTVRQDGCEDTASFTLVITPRPAAAFDYSFPEGCGSMTVSFSNQSTEAQFYVWDFGDGSAPSNALDPTHTYAAPGRYNVQLRVNAPGYCRDSIIATRLVDVTDGAPAQFSSEPAAPASLALPYATVSFTDSTPGAVVWLWQFGDGQSSTRQNPTYEYTTPGLYTVTLTATDRNGCTYQAQAGTFTVFDPQLVIANVFTPNGDGVNDFWYPEYTGGGELRAFVFDRFGREMFSGTGRTARWNGNTPSGQPAMEGVYFYQVEVDDKLYKGTITLLR